MMKPNMIYKDLHQLSRKAVTRMLKMVQRDGDLTDFHERQLVHAIFMQLDSMNKNLWAAFEYRYFIGDKWLNGKADICAWANNYYAWFEIKSTGLNPEGWDNTHRGIWKDDVKKLLQVRKQPRTQTGWIWLFLFETYRSKVRKLGMGENWTPRRRAEELADYFGRVDTESGRLARSLHEAGLFATRHGTKAIISIIPQLPRARYNEGRDEYSALLLTMDFSKSHKSLAQQIQRMAYSHR